MLIGLISDTHGLLRPEAVQALAGVDLLLHAGDLHSRDILAGLEAIAPLQAVLGNNDSPADWLDLPHFFRGEYEGVRILMIHEVAHLRPDMLTPKPDLIIFGHSHKPAFYEQEGIHYLNPGAAGHKRFSLPISVALLKVDAGKWEVRFINLLDERPLP